MYNATVENPKFCFFHQMKFSYFFCYADSSRVLSFQSKHGHQWVSAGLKFEDTWHTSTSSLFLEYGFLGFWLRLYQISVSSPYSILMVILEHFPGLYLQSPIPAQSKYPGYTCRKKLALCFAPWAQWQTIKNILLCLQKGCNSRPCPLDEPQNSDSILWWDLGMWLIICKSWNFDF